MIGRPHSVSILKISFRIRGASADPAHPPSIIAGTSFIDVAVVAAVLRPKAPWWTAVIQRDWTAWGDVSGLSTLLSQQSTNLLTPLQMVAVLILQHIHLLAHNEKGKDLTKHHGVPITSNGADKEVRYVMCLLPPQHPIFSNQPPCLLVSQIGFI